ncbi:BON domain-containing protein [Halotalea alkalilenta]|uniref:BON domain-containing protein n=1 Tax=Halotalea alkalilenta TaxID=376489 RepID=A0A172YE70_9GAMM|nr:BON domain-containing protein [Halotalea alkalilenta]ANF57533.1 hypothetical protein A5892_08685 [Halotalea alkalilenta]
MSNKRLPLLLIAAVLLATGCSTGSGGTSASATAAPATTRSAETARSDADLARSLYQQLSQTPGFAQAHINVDSFNGYVLLTGQVPNQEFRAQAEQQAQAAQGARAVHNALVVGANTSPWQRMQDTWITTRVVSSLRTASAIDSSRLHVITENGVVYMMGLIRPYEADNLVNIAGRVAGVRSVVKVFEFVQ